MAPRTEKGENPPWGWWLRVEGGFVVDEDGRKWTSVRDAYWQGRLGFPPVHVAAEQPELLLSVLTSLHRRFVDGAEGKVDLFGGDMIAWQFYHCWLVSTGLCERPPKGALGFEATLTDEGRAVMRMLHATRDPAWAHLPMREVRTSGRDAADAARERELQAFEAEAVHLPWIFGRRRVAASFVVTLTGMAVDSRMRTLRVVWTQAFADEKTRDDFFAWMAERVERWEDWGRIAYHRGADALTRHLLEMVVVSPPGAS